MRGKEHRRELEPVDEQAADVIRRIIDRSHDLVPAEPAQPSGRRVKERGRDFLIVDRLEHPETADIGLMQGVVIRIVARQDAPHDFAAAASQEKFSFPMLEKRMLLLIEKFFSLEQERRDPGRIVRINTPRELDESVAVRSRSDPANFDLRYE